ncbi:hypothetical protein ACFPOG_12605 [Paenibacillus aestuarii]|uniref:Flp pilus-assembly TadG-like N-terminal domain-containing protein n=1 Tax=Paenibacillus aestuarii TaxID=516965 RepID=A0ABW0K770_9BACL
MSKLKEFLQNENGSASIMVISLIALILCISLMVVAVDYPMMVTKVKRIKHQLNSAVHAASLSINEQRLADGFLELDTTTAGINAKDMFFKYLRLSMRLDTTNKALSESYLPTGDDVIVHELVYVDTSNGLVKNLKGGSTTCSYIAGKVTCNLVLNSSTPKPITRKVDEIVVGPSVVAVIQAYHKGIGLLGSEPLVISAVQEVEFRKK